MKNYGPLTFVAAIAVAAYRLVKLSAGKITYNTAAATDDPIGVTLIEGAIGDDVSVETLRTGGTLEIEAAGAITQDADVYAAADGRVVALAGAAADAKKIGTAKQAASGAGSVIEIIPDPGLIKHIMQAGTGGVVANGLVKLSAGTIVKNTATSTDDPIGVSKSAAAVDAYSPVDFLGSGKPIIMIAAGAITLNSDVYAAADGKVQGLPAVAATYRKIGIALEAAAEDGDEILVLPYDFNAIETVN